MARESQYVDAYLRGNAARGIGRGITVSSFIGCNIQGKARLYSGGYIVALDRALSRRVQEGTAVRDKSAGGRTAYYPKD